MCSRGPVPPKRPLNAFYMEFSVTFPTFFELMGNISDFNAQFFDLVKGQFQNWNLEEKRIRG